MSKYKHYPESPKGKAEFTKEVIEPLLNTADTGWTTADYESPTPNQEFVTITNGYEVLYVNVHMDSLQAMVRDVMKAVR